MGNDTYRAEEVSTVRGDQAGRPHKTGERLRQPRGEGLKMAEDTKSDSHLYSHQFKN